MGRSTPIPATPVTPATPALVVDDDEGIRDVVLDLLAEEGYGPSGVASLAEARAHLRAASAAHVVLLDYLLGASGMATSGEHGPGTEQNSGLALLRECRGDPRLGRHCYVLMTALNPARLAEEDARLLEELCVELVRKPFSIDDLLRAVASAAARLPPTP